MNRSVMKIGVDIFAGAMLFVSCAQDQNKQKDKVYSMVEVAQSGILWTGVAVSKEGRLFVNYPRWSPDITHSVVEIKKSQIHLGTERTEPYRVFKISEE